VKNPLKRTDVFRCNQEAHRRFGGNVSVHHVLREKKCWPTGCLYFLWHCIRLEKGGRCPHRFTRPGRLCGGCTHYVEEKIHLQPSLRIDAGELERLEEDVEAFEEWAVKAGSAPRPVAGRIATVKPWFEKTVDGASSHVALRGYLLVMKRGFIGLDALDDTLYVRVLRSLQAHHRFVPKMGVELWGEIRMDRGRVVVVHPKRVEVVRRGWGWHWTDAKALVAVRTAALIEEQSDACLECSWGALADVVDLRGSEEMKYRNLFCLKGNSEPELCTVGAIRALRKDGIRREAASRTE
jgi:hypothetical protein